MHVIKVAQLFFRSMHFACKLAKVYIIYSGEILELVYTHPYLYQFYMVY